MQILDFILCHLDKCLFLSRRNYPLGWRYYWAGVFNTFQRRSFSSISPLLVNDEMKTWGISAGNSFLIAAVNSSSSISLLLMAITNCLCNNSGLYFSSSLTRISYSCL